MSASASRLTPGKPEPGGRFHEGGTRGHRSHGASQRGSLPLACPTGPFCALASFSCALASCEGRLPPLLSSPTDGLALSRPHSGALLPWVLFPRTALAAAGYRIPGPPCPWQSTLPSWDPMALCIHCSFPRLCLSFPLFLLLLLPAFLFP